MKIYTTITPAYEQACQKWLLDSIAEVEPEANIDVIQFDEIQGKADFQAPDFNWHNVEKNLMIQEWIKENRGDIIFVTDSDIVYFRPFIDELMKNLADAKMAFSCKGMDEGYNLGQMVLKCDDEVLEFFERVGEGLALNVWDEDYVNHLLSISPISRANLNRLFTDTSSWAALDEKSRITAFSYHATETFPTVEYSSLERKELRIAEVLAWRSRSASPLCTNA